MFTYNDESRRFWFNGNTFEPNIKFELMGILTGIAIYNSVILDIHMPLAIYKKLLNIQPDITDLYELMPSVAKSMKYILETDDPNLEESLYQPFTVEVDEYGSSKIHELLPDGGEMFVN